MTWQEVQEHPEFGRAATNLAIATANLRDAEDRLLMVGRDLRDTDADRHMPTDNEMEMALDVVGAVSIAHLHLRKAEELYEKQRDKVRGPMPK